jgi:hypothetical protein
MGVWGVAAPTGDGAARICWVELADGVVGRRRNLKGDMGVLGSIWGEGEGAMKSQKGWRGAKRSREGWPRH